MENQPPPDNSRVDSFRARLDSNDSTPDNPSDNSRAGSFRQRLQPSEAGSLMPRVVGLDHNPAPNSIADMLPNLPPQQRSFRIFGKSTGEISDKAKELTVAGAKKTFTKENAFFTGTSILLKLGMGSAGIGGLPLTVAGAGTMGGIRAHYNETNEYWKRERAAKGVDHLGVRDTLKGFFTVADMKRNGKIALGIGKGATFGMLGNFVGGFVSEAAPLQVARGAIGEKLEGGINKALEWKQSWSAPSVGMPEIHGPDIHLPSVELPKFEPPKIELPKPDIKLPQVDVPVIGGIGNMAHGAADIAGGGVHDVTSGIGDFAKSDAPLRDKPLGINEVAEKAGGLFHNIGQKVGEMTHLEGNMPWDHGRYIEPGKYIGRNLMIPDNAPEWLQYDNIHDIHGEYAEEIQGAVAVNLSKKWNEILDIATDVAKQHGHTLSEEDQLNIMNNAMHIMEVHGNQAFDSHLEQVINGSKDLADASWLGNHDLDTWANSPDFVNNMQEGANIYFNVQDQLTQEIINNPQDLTTVTIIGKSVFEQLFPNLDLNDQEAVRKVVDEMGVHIAINQKTLLRTAIEQWKDSHQIPLETSINDIDQFWNEFNFPAYSAELNSLMEKARAGDAEAITRLKSALGIKSNSLFRPLSFWYLKKNTWNLVLDKLKLLGK